MCNVVVAAVGMLAGADAGAASLRLSSRPDNDDFANRTEFVSSQPVLSSLRFASRESGEPNSQALRSVWYRWQPIASGAYFFAIGSESPALLSVFSGTNLVSLAKVWVCGFHGQCLSLGEGLSTSLLADFECQHGCVRVGGHVQLLSQSA